MKMNPTPRKKRGGFLLKGTSASLASLILFNFSIRKNQKRYDFFKKRPFYPKTTPSLATEGEKLRKILKKA
jgi:hypothetical protein